MSDLPWMDTAWAEVDNLVPVRGSFVARVVEICGIRCDQVSTADAKSWLGFGDDLSGPISGCLVIFRRGAGESVGFVVADDGERLHVLGNDQNNTIGVLICRKTDVLGYRRPSGHPRPGPRDAQKPHGMADGHHHGGNHRRGRHPAFAVAGSPSGGHIMRTILAWLRDNVGPVVLVVVAILAFRFGKQTEETAQQKEKVNARNETIKRQKAVVEANSHSPPDAVTQRLRDGDA